MTRVRRNGRKRAETTITEPQPAPKASERYVRRDGVEAAKAPLAGEMEQRRKYVERLYLAGGSTRAIVYMAMETMHITKKQAHYALEQVRDDVTTSFEKDRSSERASAADRVRNDLLRMRTLMSASREHLKEVQQKRPTWSDINRHEMLLARITGTLAPIRVKVDTDLRVRESLIAVIGGMDRQAMDARIDHLMEQERDAGAHVVVGTPA